VDFFTAMDAANVDLKSFNPDFYRRIVGGRLDVILDTLRYIAHETSCWLEITTLLIPGLNDSNAEIHQLAEWVSGELGVHVPVHFTAFHPDNRLRDLPRTPTSTLSRARKIGLESGLRYVYTGNVVDRVGSTTFCPTCSREIICRDGYDVTTYALSHDGDCSQCGQAIDGLWDTGPGHFGNRRVPIGL
jgi:pyruvate formate lyase activating enzyme